MDDGETVEVTSCIIHRVGPIYSRRQSQTWVTYPTGIASESLMLHCPETVIGIGLWDGVTSSCKETITKRLEIHHRHYSPSSASVKNNESERCGPLYTKFSPMLI